ncbi:MAG TPA: GNAT family N-acetyltransferase [Dokdonella sp.]|nr:GNAT family N-acetyltransferase [Dokdonella sp.]
MNARAIEYRKDAKVDLDQFIGLYRESTLAERRPADDREVMRQMMENASLTITAWDGDALVGISRTLSDFCYVAYLSDLAVAKSHQHQGIGKRLIMETQAALGPRCMLVLLSAPAANEFYPKLGFSHNPRAWVLGAGECVR